MKVEGKPCESCGEPLPAYAACWAVELWAKLGRDRFMTHVSTVYACGKECAEAEGTRCVLYALADDRHDPRVEVYELATLLPSTFTRSSG